jgi:hypothetical protein
MGKRQAFIDLYRAGGGRKDFIALANSYGVKDPFEALTIYDMLMSGALPSELKHGGIASLAPRKRYARGSGRGRQDPMGGFAHQSAQEMREAAPDQFGGGMNISHGGGEGQNNNVISSPITNTGRTNYDFNLGDNALSPSFAFKYSPAKAANLRARIYNQNLSESDDINVDGSLSGTVGPVDYNTQFTDQGLGDTNLNYNNFSANIDPNKNYNIGYQTNRDGWNTGVNYDSDGRLMATIGTSFNKGGLAGILEV